MRRITTGLLAFLALVGTFLVLPVVSASVPAPTPVPVSSQQVALGSVTAPAPAAEVQLGTTAAVTDVPPTTPTLSLTRTDVHAFSAVGLTWTYDPGVTDTEVRVRVQDADGDWGSWTEVETDPDDADGGPVRPGARSGTSPYWTGPSTGVQVQLTTRSGGQPTDVRLDLIDPGTSPADADLGTGTASSTAHGAMAMPPVYSRAQWGADESIRDWDPEYASTIKAFALHHTDDTNNYTADQVPAMIRAIYQFHTVGRGWGDIGYNVLVDKFGRLWEGRYGGLSSTVIGAHTGGFNTYTFAVSMIGNYDTAGVPQAVVDAVSSFVAWKFSLYGVDPNGVTTLISGGGGTDKFDPGVPVTLPTIFGHRDTGNTACPGKYGYAQLPAIRQQVTARLAASRTPIENRYWNDPGLRAALGAPVGTEASANGVNWQVYPGGRLYSSAGGGVRLVRGSILDTYLAAGGPPVLGPPISDDAASPGAGGFYVRFQGGDIYYSAATGTQIVRGAILATWLTWGGSAGVLGFPTTSDAPTAEGRGFSTRFQGGDVYWSAATGAQVVRGGIRDAWLATGGSGGPLGFPTTSDAPSPGTTGAFTRFQGGDVYWSPSTGSQVVRGAILATWLTWGGSAGVLGFPTTSDAPTADGRGFYTRFQGGDVYWSAASGTQVVRGGIRDAWLAAGGSGGPLGFPVTSDSPSPDGRGAYTRFQGGDIYWSPSSGSQIVRGAILSTWATWGGTRGVLGFPTTSDAPTADGGGFYTRFQGGDVYYSAATGTQVVRGGILDAWLAAGGSGGVLGYPVTSDAPTADGRGATVRFQGGAVYWSAATGTHVVRGALATAYATRGASASTLGFPTVDTYAVTGGLRSDFQHGSMTWTSATDTITVTP